MRECQTLRNGAFGLALALGELIWTLERRTRPCGSGELGCAGVLRQIRYYGWLFLY